MSYQRTASSPRSRRRSRSATARPAPAPARPRSQEELGVQLRPALRPAWHEADERVTDLDVRADALALEHLRQRRRLRLRIVGLEVQLGQTEPVALLEQFVDPIARRVQLEPVARIRRDERAPPAVLLHAQVGLVRARECALELVVVEREAEMVDARQRPLPRLHHDVHGTELELGQPQLEAHRVELRPRKPGLIRRQVFADAAVPRDQVEAELADVSCFDLAHAARDEVVVEQVHARAWYGGLVLSASKPRWIGWGSITSTSL